MKQQLLILLIIILPLVAQEYTLDMLLEAAYKNSDAMAIAQLKMQNSELHINLAKRKLMPSILFQVDYDHSLGGDDVTMNSLTDEYVRNSPVVPSSPNFTGDTLVTGLVEDRLSLYFPQRNNLTMGIDVYQPLWQQNKIRNSIKALKIANRSSICQWQDAQMQVKAEVTRLFYRALLAKQRIRIEEEAARRNEKAHELVVDYYRARMRSELDTLNSYIDYVSGEISVSEALREYRDVRKFILAYTNLPIPYDSLRLLGDLQPETYDKSYQEIEEHFLRENKVLTVLRAQYDQAVIGVKITKGDYLPVLYGGVSFERFSRFDNSDDFKLEPYRKLYLGLTYNIFEGGQRSIRVKEQEHQSLILKHRLDEAQKHLTVELKSLYDKKQEYAMRMDESKRLLEAAQKGYDIAFDSYKSGLIKQIELDDSNDRLLRAELFYAQSIYNYNSTVIDLRIYAADYLFTN